MKYLDIIQNEFMDKSASMLLFAAKPKQKSKIPAKVKPKGGYVKSERVGPTDFLKAMGDREVTNPDPKAKKTKVKIKSLKAAPQGSPQNRLYIQLYKQWKGVGAAGVKEITKRDKAVASLKDKLKQQREKLKAQKPDVSAALEKANVALKAEREKFKKYKEEQKTKKPKVIDEDKSKVTLESNDIKPAETPDIKTEEETVKLEDIGAKSEEQWKQKIATINTNKPLLKNNVDVFIDPPRPKTQNVEKLREQLDQMNQAFKALGYDKVTNTVDIINSPNFTTVQMKITDPIFKATQQKDILSGKTADAISSFIKMPGVMLSKNLDASKDFDISVQIPKGIDMSDRDTVTFKELIASDQFKNARKKKPGACFIPIGRDVNNDVQVIDYGKDVNHLIGGATGSGKTVGLHNVIESIQYGYTPDEVKMILIDPKNNELKRYSKSKFLALPPVLASGTDTEFVKQVQQSLQYVKVENMNRKSFLANIQDLTGKTFANALNWNEFITTPIEKLSEEDKVALSKIPDDKKKPIPRIEVCIDELLKLIQIDDSYMKSLSKRDRQGKQGIVDTLTELMVEIRTQNIGITGVTQSFSDEFIPSALKDQFKGRFIYKLANEKAAEKASESFKDANKLLPTGDMVYVGESSAEPIRVQTGYISDSENDKAANQVQGEQKFIEQRTMKDIDKETTTPQELSDEAKKVQEDVKKTLQEAEDRKKQSEQEKKTDEKPTTPDAAETYLKKRQEELKRQIREKENIRKKMLTGQPTMTEDIESESENYEPTIDSGKEINIPEESSNDDLQKQIDEMTKTVPVEEVTKQKEQTEPLQQKTEQKPIEPERKKNLLDRLKKLFNK